MKNHILLCVLFGVIANVHAQTFTLDSCRTLALLHNEELKIFDNEAAQYDINRKLISAASLPSLDGGVVAFTVGDPVNDLLPQYGLNSTLSISHTLYSGGYHMMARKQNSTALELNNLSRIVNIKDLIVKVDRLFWTLVSSQEKITSINSGLILVRQLEKDALISFEAGLIDKNDLLKIQARKNEMKIQLLHATNHARITKYELGQNLNRQDTAKWKIRVNWSSPDDVLFMENDFWLSIERAAEMMIAQKEKEMKAIDRAMEMSRFLPKVNLSASSLQVNSSASEMFQDRNFLTWYATVNLSLPIFHWQQRKFTAQRYELQYKQNDYRTEQIRKELTLSYLKITNSIMESRDIYKASLTRLEQTQENLKIVKDKFSAGLMYLKDYLDAHREWLDSQAMVIHSRTNYEISKAEYKRLIDQLPIMQADIYK